MILECTQNSDCTGRTDTCTMEKCKCGELEKCSEPEFCNFGECQGMWFLILKRC